MELSDTGVDVVSVCPGPVVSEGGVNALSTDPNIVSAYSHSLPHTHTTLLCIFLYVDQCGMHMQFNPCMYTCTLHM